MDAKWNELYELAMEVTNPTEVSDSMYVGSVGAALLTKKGNIYTGVCIDTNSSLEKF